MKDTLKLSLLNGSASSPVRFGGKAPQPSPVATAKNIGPVPANRPKVMVCIPSGRTWEARTSTSVTGMCAFSAIHGVDLGIINLEGSMITKQRNDLVAMAKKNGGTHLLFVDSDLLFPPDALMRLLKHDKDIVGATYNKRVPPYETLGRLRGKPEDAKKGGLIEAELLPGGFMLFKMSVFDRVPWPWYYETYQWPGDSGVEAFKEMLRASYPQLPPQSVLDSLDGTPLAEWLNNIFNIEKNYVPAGHRWEYVSEDLNFCRKLVKAGIKIWCDLDLTFQMTHLGTLEVHCRNTDETPQKVVDAVTASVKEQAALPPPKQEPLVIAP